MHIRAKSEDHIPFLPLDGPLRKRPQRGLLAAHGCTATRHRKSSILNQRLVIPVGFGGQAHHQIVPASRLHLVQQVQSDELLIGDVTPIRTERQRLVVVPHRQLTAETAPLIVGENVSGLGGRHHAVDRLVRHPQRICCGIQQGQLARLLLLCHRRHGILSPQSAVSCVLPLGTQDDILGQGIVLEPIGIAVIDSVRPLTMGQQSRVPFA